MRSIFEVAGRFFRKLCCPVFVVDELRISSRDSRFSGEISLRMHGSYTNLLHVGTSLKKKAHLGKMGFQ